jgi:hypothetical protein
MCLVNRWQEAIRYLELGGETISPLSSYDQKELNAQLRGPFVSGMSKDDAEKVLVAMGWRKSVPSWP